MFPHLSSRARPNREGFDMDSIATPTTSTVFTDGSDLDSIEIKAALNGEAFLLGSTDPDLRFFNTDAPAMALAILTAAGYALGNDRRGSIGAHEMVDTAAGMLNDAVRIGQRNQAHAELNRRRDKLAQELIQDACYAYRHAAADQQRAIDMIIQLQDDAAKATP